MKWIQIDYSNNHWRIITETERKFLWIKLKPIRRTFEAYKEWPKGYYNWTESPDETLIGDNLYYQLCEWMNNFMAKQKNNDK